MSYFKESVFGDIPSTWNTISAEEFCQKVTDGTHDSPKQAIKGYPLITSRHIKGNEIDFERAYLISKEDYDSINRRSYVSQWDVIISMIGEYCGFTYLEENSEINYAIKNVGLFKCGDEIKSKWLYYFFQARHTNHLLKTYRSGTSQPYLSLGTLRKFPVIVPMNKQEMAAIVSILDSIRKKIENLQAQNKTLEATAQTIFKEWFGKYQVGDNLPEGWRVGTLGEALNLKSGYAFKSRDFVEDSDVKAVKIKDLKGNGVVSLTDVSSIDKECTQIARVQYFRLKQGDIILAMSGNTTGKIGVIPPHVNDIYLNQRVGKFFLNDESQKSFIYNFLMSGNFEKKILSMGYGSAQPNISPAQIQNIKIVLPTIGLQRKYLKISDPIYSKVLSNNKNIQTLKKTRDTLLPKLMSGQLRVNMS